MRDGLNPSRTTPKNTLKRLEISPVKAIKAKFINTLHLKRSPRYFEINDPISSTC
jgi:hypothetical protein